MGMEISFHPRHPMPGAPEKSQAQVQRPNPQVSWEVSLNLTRQPHICVTFPPALIALLFHAAWSQRRFSQE